MILIPILLPIIGGILLSVFRFQNRRARMWYLESLVLVNSLLVFWLLFHRPSDSFTLLKFTGSLSVTFRIDGLSCVFGGLIAFLWPLATLYAFEYMKTEHRENLFFSFYTMTYGVTLGIAFADNLITLYFFYELLTLVTVPLVIHTMTKKAIRATRKYLYYSLGGAAFAFIGVIFILSFGTSSQFVYGGVLDPLKTAGKEPLLLFIYLLTFMGFGVKAAVFPLHDWLPNASVAPTPVTALLHAVAVVKSGVFGIIRITYYSFGVTFLEGSHAQTIAMLIAMATILYGSSMAVKELHFKRRLAYSTISNLSYILLGVTLMTPLGLFGALCHMVVHAVMKICSFFSAGAILHQSGREYIYQLDGLGKRMPVTFTTFTIAALSLCGVPLTAGFQSKWRLGASMVEAHNPWGYAALGVLLFSSLLTAIYMFTVVIRGFFKEPLAGSETITDPNWLMKLPLLIFAACILLVGVYSKPLLDFLYQVASGVI